MFEKHTTAQNETMLIAEMTDSHLINTIKRFIRTAQEI